ncbi:hypothetical protein M3669_12170, partial [Staphylococcus capitis]|nr:hypothetical protein [Staphylococcus capitis]
ACVATPARDIAATVAATSHCVFMFHSFIDQRDDVLHPYDDGGVVFIPGLPFAPAGHSTVIHSSAGVT